MASIFLSYARADLACAERLARVLEQARHEVWWDRHIGTGREFSAEIEAALEKADIVLVAWSKNAAKSPWVRDEAAIGRDSGRLLPVLIDGGQPPIGFRQFQALDLSRWKGRDQDPRTKELIDAVDAQLGGKAAQFGRIKRRFGWFGRRSVWAAAFGILLIAAAAAIAIWLWRSAGAPDQPRIAIRPADGSPLSRQASRDLVLRVPNLPGADATAYQLLDAGQTTSKADAVLTVAASTNGGRERRDLVLRALNDAIIWSATIDKPSAASASLLQQLAIEAQRALTCAAEALAYRRESFGQDTLRIYLSACTNFDNSFASGENWQQYKLFEQVIAKAPHFEPAWAKLLALELKDIEGSSNRHGLLLATRAHLAQAQKLGLDFGELYAARRVWIAPTDFVRIFRNFHDAIEHYPKNAALYRMLARQSWYVGRMGDAEGLSKVAVQLDPLSSANEQTLIIAYAYAGHTEDAFAELRKAEELFPGAPTLDSARYGLELRYGDPKKALALLQQTVDVGQISSQQAAFLRARIDPSPANIERSIAEDRMIYEQDPNFIAQIVQTLAQFGRKDEVIDIMLHYGGGAVAGIESEVFFRPALRDVWRDPRSIAAAAHLGLLHYWKVSGNWPDFCSDPTLPYACKKEAAKYRV